MRIQIFSLILVAVFPALGFACTKDSQCGHGFRCERGVDSYTLGQCVSARDKFGRVGSSTEEAKKSNSSSNSKCFFDADCGNGGHCIIEKGASAGTCGT